MAIPTVFIQSNEALKKVVDQIKDDQWGMKVPTSWTRGKEMTLREIINYHSYDDAWVPDVLAGKTAEEVGTKFDGDLLGDDPKGNFAKYNQEANDAVQDFSDLEEIVHLSYGDWPAGEYLKHITSFRGFRAVDIARFIGVNDKLPDDLVQGLWDELSPNVEDWRKMGVFGPAVPTPEDADLQTKLLGLVGREPK